jgi:hypothetical protein
MKPIQFKVNLPRDVKKWLEAEAHRNVRPQGAQIVMCLRQAMSDQISFQERGSPHESSI